jgi:hypothetical protein
MDTVEQSVDDELAEERGAEDFEKSAVADTDLDVLVVVEVLLEREEERQLEGDAEGLLLREPLAVELRDFSGVAETEIEREEVLEPRAVLESLEDCKVVGLPLDDEHEDGDAEGDTEIKGLCVTVSLPDTDGLRLPLCEPLNEGEGEELALTLTLAEAELLAEGDSERE